MSDPINTSVPSQEKKDPPVQSVPTQPPRVIDIRGELEVTILKSLSADKNDVYTQCELAITITLDDHTREGVIVLDANKTKRFLKLLNLEGV